ncbi:MAG: hypothetical protein ACP5VR_12970 [Acidimicrobiales bacterium]
MALWLLRGLRRGVITTRYPSPSAADSWAASLPTPPAFDAAKLSGETADRLVEVCPSRALSREGNELVIDLGACTACGRCIAVAGGAARPSGVFELAAKRPGDLVKRVAVRAS